MIGGGHLEPVRLVEFTRGGQTESTHFGSIAVADADGRLVVSVGDPQRMTFMRSSAKPFQAMAVVETGCVEALGLTSAELALIAASHSGEPRHTEAAGHILSRAGLTETALLCGVHAPLHAPTRLALERRGESPTALHHNCSGKHCGLVCACVHRGWDLRTYPRPDHPLQRQILKLVADAAGLEPRSVSVALDGCGVPTFAVPLVAFATAFARLAAEEQLGGQHREAARTVRSAMLAHPEMVAGEGRFDTDLMSLGEGRLLAKGGAEACHGVALLDRGWGIAVKIEDGGSRAVPVAVVEALRQLEAVTERDPETLRSHARPPVRNYRGEIVGEGRPSFQLDRKMTV